MRAASIILAIVLGLAYLSDGGRVAAQETHSTALSKKDDVDKALVDKIRGRAAQPSAAQPGAAQPGKKKKAPAERPDDAAGDTAGDAVRTK